MWQVGYKRESNLVFVYVENPDYRRYETDIVKEPSWFEIIVLKLTWEDKIRIAFDKAQRFADKWNLQEEHKKLQEEQIDIALEKLRQEKGVKSLNRTAWDKRYD